MHEFNILCKNLKIENILGVVLDKDGTLTDSNVYWAEIIRRRTSAISKRFNLSSNKYSFICESMGLDIDRNILIPQGPIAIKTRDEVVSNVVKKLGFLHKDIPSCPSISLNLRSIVSSLLVGTTRPQKSG